MNHIAFLIPTLDRIGGAEQQVIALAKALPRRGWRVSVVSLSGSGGAAQAELAEAGAGYLSLGMRKGLADPRGWLRFNQWLRRHKPDVVHAHLPHATWFARWSRLGAPIRVVVDTLHTASTGTAGRRIGYRCSGWLGDRVTAVSQAVASAHVAAGMVGPAGVVVLPNGVDTDTWRPSPAPPPAPDLPQEDKFLWLASGRLDPVKDYPTLLRAMAGLPASARLVIAGAGPQLSDLQQLAIRLGLGNRVHFLGFEPLVRSWMQAADGFVLSSLWEGLPVGLLEAAACELPAVATDVPGTREAIAPLGSEWLTPVGDATALRAAMAALMLMPRDQRRAMGARARQTVIERFSLNAALDNWEALYRSLLAQNPSLRRWGRSQPAPLSPGGQSAPQAARRQQPAGKTASAQP